MVDRREATVKLAATEKGAARRTGPGHSSRAALPGGELMSDGKRTSLIQDISVPGKSNGISALRPKILQKLADAS
jgi:hypothetical protein